MNWGGLSDLALYLMHILSKVGLCEVTQLFLSPGNRHSLWSYEGVDATACKEALANLGC